MKPSAIKYIEDVPLYRPINDNFHCVNSVHTSGNSGAALKAFAAWVALFFLFSFVIWPLVFWAIEIEGGV